MAKPPPPPPPKESWDSYNELRGWGWLEEGWTPPDTNAESTTQHSMPTTSLFDRRDWKKISAHERTVLHRPTPSTRRRRRHPLRWPPAVGRDLESASAFFYDAPEIVGAQWRTRAESRAMESVSAWADEFAAGLRGPMALLELLLLLLFFYAFCKYAE